MQYAHVRMSKDRPKLTKAQRKAIKARRREKARFVVKVDDAVDRHPLLAQVQGVMQKDAELGALLLAKIRNNCGPTTEALYRAMQRHGIANDWRFVLWTQNGDYHTYLTRAGLAVDLSNTHESDQTGHFFPAPSEAALVAAAAPVGAQVSFHDTIESWVEESARRGSAR
jgi:hypothetical protein